MSFRMNSSQQITLTDCVGFLSERKQQMLEKSWAGAFSDKIFRNIDEKPFMVLYSENSNSRPNAPVNVIVGALIIKELFGLTDDEIREACEFDFRYQYALHTTSFDEQPISDRTFSRFRSRCAAYEILTGTDLIHSCIVSLASEIAAFMGISPSIKRMDSMMIGAAIRKMGRLELLYTCLSNLVKELKRDGSDLLKDEWMHYAEPDDRNRVVYHDSDIPQAERLQKVIDDACELLPLCEAEYGNTEDWLLLKRVIDEQTKTSDPGDGKKNGSGVKRVPKTKEDGMDSSVLQNPSDPDATYRMKAGKEHRGYCANITEDVSENGSVITDYQYDVNTRSDSDFLMEKLESVQTPADTEEKSVLYTDGAYSTEATRKMAEKKGISLISTGVLGRPAKDILADFTFTEDGKNVLKCAAGNEPKKSTYIASAGQVRISFQKHVCEKCPLREQCGPKMKTRTAMLMVSSNGQQNALEARKRKNDSEYRLAGRIRNGAETVPSLIRNKFQVDRMPVRGLLRTKQFFGFKIAAANFVKLLRYTRGQSVCFALKKKNA